MRNWIKRIIFYIVGLVVMAFGIAMTLRAGIGVAPGGTIPYSVFLISPLSVGLCTTFFQIFCVLAQLAITRRLTLKLSLQFPLAYVFGFLIDLFYEFWDISFTGIFYSILFLLAGMIVFSLGIRIVVGTNILLTPPDGLAQTMGNVFGWPMSKAKLLFDIIATVTAAVLTLILAGNAFLAVGIGTVICAIGTGPAIGFYTKLFPFFDAGMEKT